MVRFMRVPGVEETDVILAPSMEQARPFRKRWVAVILTLILSVLMYQTTSGKVVVPHDREGEGGAIIGESENLEHDNGESSTPQQSDDDNEEAATTVTSHPSLRSETATSAPTDSSKEETSAPTASPTASPTEPPPPLPPPPSPPSELSQIGEEYTQSHVVFSDLHYRRVCAPSYSSFLCMVLRFPFEVPLQDPNITYPSPYDARFNDIRNCHPMSSDSLKNCTRRQEEEGLGIDETVKECLPSGDGGNTVHVLWTRQPKNATTAFIFDHSLAAEQEERRKHFLGGDHTFIVLGASPTPPITEKIKYILGGRVCGTGQVSVCPGEPPNGRIHLAYSSYYFDQRIPSETVTAHLAAHNFAPLDYKPGDELKPLTILVEYPFAHAQVQTLVLDRWEDFVTISRGAAEIYMQLETEAGARELAELGFRLERLLVFDGLPQYFPTETGGYVPEIGKKSHTESEFIQNEGYEGWRPDYGTACRGPIPPNSRQTAANQLERDSFEAAGYDMRWFGRTREFANQLWFTTHHWKTGNKAGLDCTHQGSLTGYYDVHKYVFQAMVDDFYDERGLYLASAAPSLGPTFTPSVKPSLQPSVEPSMAPSAQPSAQPSLAPSGRPSHSPSGSPSQGPSVRPSESPSEGPSVEPSSEPSLKPSKLPSKEPSPKPSSNPSGKPSTNGGEE